MPAIGGADEIIEAWLGAMVFLEQDWYLGAQASLWVAELGQDRKEGVVVVEIIPRCCPMTGPV
jgi:hypothetical protein